MLPDFFKAPKNSDRVLNPVRVITVIFLTLSLVGFLLIFSPSTTHAQQSGQKFKLRLNGYLKELGSLGAGNQFEHFQYDNILHNRIESEWSYGQNLTLNADLRTRLINGYTVRHQPGYAELLENDPGYADLSWTPVHTSQSILHTNIDRLNLSYYSGDFQVNFGRQRINWSRTFVWSPNDLFNNFAYLDFDYEERPGTDALNLQYSWSYASSVQLTTQFGHHWDESVIASMLRSSLGTYDVQVVAGHYYDQWALGAGWAGYLKSAGFKGEITYFQPEHNFLDQSGHFTATTGLDYMFPSSLYVQGEILYNGGWKRTLNPTAQLLQPPRADNLFIARTATFLNLSYPVHPLINVSFSSIISPDRPIYVFIPQATFSLSDNVDLLLLSQLFKGRILKQATPTPNYFYFRIKWSF